MYNRGVGPLYRTVKRGILVLVKGESVEEEYKRMRAQGWGLPSHDKREK